MKKGWEIKRLPEIAEYFIGLTYSPKDIGSEGTIVLRSSNVQNDALDLSDLVRVTCSVKKPLHVRKGDILMCSRNGSKRLVGKTAVIGDLPEEMTFGTFMTVIRSELNPYLSWFFRSEAFRDQIGVGENTMINQITKYMLDVIRVPVPPLAEQQRIVGLLDEAFEGLATAKANAEKNPQNARALFESHLQSVFTQRGPGWVETTLEDCCEQIFAGGDVPKDRLSQERTAEFSVPIYSNGEKNDGLYGFTDVARVTKPSITVSARGTLGFTAIRTEPFLPVVRLIVLVPNETKIALSFLYYAVVGMDFGNTGTSIPQLTVPNFKESKLHVPSIPEQEAIVEKLDALSAETQRLARLYEQKLAALEALKKSLLHQAFAGEL